MLRKAYKGFLAAITSTEAVRAEKSIAVLIAVRLAITFGASAGIVELISRLAG